MTDHGTRVASNATQGQSTNRRRKHPSVAVGSREAQVPAELENDGSELPEGWATCRVGDVFDVFSGGTPSRSEPRYWKGKIPWLSSGDIKADEIEVGSEFITESGLQNSTAKLCEPGSVVVVVRSGVLKHTLPVACSIADSADWFSPQRG